MTSSLKKSLLQLNRQQRQELESLIEELDYRWSLQARDKQKLPPGDWVTWLILAGRGWGKMLDIETDVKTTHGWKKLKDIKDGDHVYNLEGRPVTVLKAHDIQYSPGYLLTFDTGEQFKACKDHLWYTISKNEDKQIRRGKRDKGSVKSTQEIVDTIKHLGRETNHRIPVISPTIQPYQNLPIDSYLLGIWLGDGSSYSSSITIPEQETVIELKQRGHTVHYTNILQHTVDKRNLERNNRGQFIENGSLHSQLKKCNLINNKHIPRVYLDASIDQRLDLVKGLMDADGHCETNGWCEYTTVRKQLCDDFMELVSSLGIKARVYEGDASYNGKVTGRKYRVFFKTDILVFTLQRKLERQLSATKAQMSRHRNRFIVSAEPIDKCSMRCLTVDDTDGLFLIGKTFIATHNTLVGSQTVRIWSEQVPIIHLVGRTSTDVRDTMVEGPAGILAVHPDRNKPKYEPSKRRITWPNGCKAVLFTADEPDLLRGPQCYKAWADELASWQYVEDAWDMLMMGLRLGNHPQILATTTPRPIPTIRELVKDPTTILTKGSTFENEANLAEPFLKKILAKYEGTRIGRQELYAELLEDVEGALWSHKLIEKGIVKEAPDMERIVVALDPATTDKDTSDEFGIIVAGVDAEGYGYVLKDLTGKYSPSEWARVALNAYYDHKADRIVAEANQGGDMIEHTLRVYDSAVSYKSVHASKGKKTRAEPIAALYEQHKVKHLGHLPELETEMTTWAAKEGEKSPNRVDALVWAMTELMLTHDTFFVV